MFVFIEIMIYLTVLDGLSVTFLFVTGFAGIMLRPSLRIE